MSLRPIEIASRARWNGFAGRILEIPGQVENKRLLSKPVRFILIKLPLYIAFRFARLLLHCILPFYLVPQVINAPTVVKYPLHIGTEVQVKVGLLFRAGKGTYLLSRGTYSILWNSAGGPQI